MGKVNLENILESVKRTNGASYDPVTGKLNPHTGYMVSLTGYTMIVPVNDGFNLEMFRVMLQRYLDKRVWQKIIDTNVQKLSLTANYGNVYIGIWKTNDSLVFDLSVRILDRIAALKFADENHQQAIWDCLAGKEIYPSHKLI